MSQRTERPGSMDERHRAIRAWLPAELAWLPPGDAGPPATLLPVADLIARLEAGACVDECALIDAEVCDDGCVLADEPGLWEVAR